MEELRVVSRAISFLYGPYILLRAITLSPQRASSIGWVIAFAIGVAIASGHSFKGFCAEEGSDWGCRGKEFMNTFGMWIWEEGVEWSVVVGACIWLVRFIATIVASFVISARERAALEEIQAQMRERVNQSGGKGLVALVTGANSGIGKELAVWLAQSGVTVVMGCRSSARGEAAAEDIRKRAGEGDVGDVMVVRMDVSSLNSVERGAREVARVVGKVDFVFCNAGIMPIGFVDFFIPLWAVFHDTFATFLELGRATEDGRHILHQPAEGNHAPGYMGPECVEAPALLATHVIGHAKLIHALHSHNALHTTTPTTTPRSVSRSRQARRRRNSASARRGTAGKGSGDEVVSSTTPSSTSKPPQTWIDWIVADHRTQVRGDLVWVDALEEKGRLEEEGEEDVVEEEGTRVIWTGSRAATAAQFRYLSMLPADIASEVHEKAQASSVFASTSPPFSFSSSLPPNSLSLRLLLSTSILTHIYLTPSILPLSTTSQWLQLVPALLSPLLLILIHRIYLYYATADARSAAATDNWQHQESYGEAKRFLDAVNPALDHGTLRGESDGAMVSDLWDGVGSIHVPTLPQDCGDTIRFPPGVSSRVMCPGFVSTELTPGFMKLGGLLTLFRPMLSGFNFKPEPGIAALLHLAALPTSKYLATPVDAKFVMHRGVLTAAMKGKQPTTNIDSKRCAAILHHYIKPSK